MDRGSKYSNGHAKVNVYLFETAKLYVLQFYLIHAVKM